MNNRCGLVEGSGYMKIIIQKDENFHSKRIARMMVSTLCIIGVSMNVCRISASQSFHANQV